MNPTDLAQLYAIAVAAVAGLAIPAVVDVVTKSHLASGVKALFATVLSASAGALATVTITPGVHWQTVAVSMVSAFVAAMSAHRTGYSDVVQRVTAGFGVGPANPAPADPLRSTQSAATEGPGVVGSGDGGYSLVELIVVAFFAVLILVVLVKVL